MFMIQENAQEKSMSNGSSGSGVVVSNGSGSNNSSSFTNLINGGGNRIGSCGNLISNGSLSSVADDETAKITKTLSNLTSSSLSVVSSAFNLFKQKYNISNSNLMPNSSDQNRLYNTLNSTGCKAISSNNKNNNYSEFGISSTKHKNGTNLEESCYDQAYKKNRTETDINDRLNINGEANSEQTSVHESTTNNDVYNDSYNEYSNYDISNEDNNINGACYSDSKLFNKINYFYHNQLPALKCKYFESPISQSQIQYDCSAPIARNSPENNEVKLVDYRQTKVASFTVDGKELICLPQAFELFLKNLVGGLHTVYTKLKRLDIVPIVCNVEQVRILRGLGAIQPGVNRCKLIAPNEFDTLYEDCTNSGSRPGRPPKRHFQNESSSENDNANNNSTTQTKTNRESPKSTPLDLQTSRNNKQLNNNCLSNSVNSGSNNNGCSNENNDVNKSNLSELLSNSKSNNCVNDLNVRLENNTTNSSSSLSPFSILTNSSCSSSSTLSSSKNTQSANKTIQNKNHQLSGLNNNQEIELSNEMTSSSDYLNGHRVTNLTPTNNFVSPSLFSSYKQDSLYSCNNINNNVNNRERETHLKNGSNISAPTNPLNLDESIPFNLNNYNMNSSMQKSTFLPYSFKLQQTGNYSSIVGSGLNNNVEDNYDHVNTQLLNQNSNLNSLNAAAAAAAFALYGRIIESNSINENFNKQQQFLTHPYLPTNSTNFGLKHPFSNPTNLNLANQESFLNEYFPQIVSNNSSSIKNSDNSNKEETSIEHAINPLINKPSSNSSFEKRSESKILSFSNHNVNGISKIQQTSNLNKKSCNCAVTEFQKETQNESDDNFNFSCRENYYSKKTINLYKNSKQPFRKTFSKTKNKSDEIVTNKKIQHLFNDHSSFASSIYDNNKEENIISQSAEALSVASYNNEHDSAKALKEDKHENIWRRDEKFFIKKNLHPLSVEYLIGNTSANLRTSEAEEKRDSIGIDNDCRASSSPSPSSVSSLFLSNDGQNSPSLSSEIMSDENNFDATQETINKIEDEINKKYFHRNINCINTKILCKNDNLDQNNQNIEANIMNHDLWIIRNNNSKLSLTENKLGFHRQFLMNIFSLIDSVKSNVLKLENNLLSNIKNLKNNLNTERKLRTKNELKIQNLNRFQNVLRNKLKIQRLIFSKINRAKRLKANKFASNNKKNQLEKAKNNEQIISREENIQIENQREKNEN